MAKKLKKVKPTWGQKRIIAAIRYLKGVHKTIPTFEEIGDHLGISKQTVASHLRKLQEKNLVDWKHRSPRTLRIL